MRCADCYAKNPEGMKFCGQCGGSILVSLPGERQRLQLTIMFCVLYGSTELSERLDPEDLRDVIRAYHNAVGHVVREFGGYVAQFLGDGLMVYFGSREDQADHARRAVQAGLGIHTCNHVLNERLGGQHGLSLSLRVGIHTGPVVMHEIGTGSTRELLALGSTPNLAARLQALADPGESLISRDTYQLVDDYFECQSLGVHAIKGFSAPCPIYWPRRERRPAEASTPRSPVPPPRPSRPPAYSRSSAARRPCRP